MPYWRLSGFYLFYFASLGVLVPYWGIYLKSLGFDAQQIGVFMALIMATRIISPNVWAYIADHSGKRLRIVRFGCFLASITFCGVFVSDEFWWLVVVMLVFSFFWNAALPQFEATTFSHLGNQTHRYSKIRIWGSIGFIVSVAGIGMLLDVQTEYIVPISLLILFVFIWLVSLSVPERAAHHMSSSQLPLTQVLQRPAVAALLITCFLMQVSHGPYYTFYSIYMEDYGYARSSIGQLWALGVFAEVVVFLIMHRLVLRFGLRLLFIISFVFAMLRWVLTGLFADFLLLMIFAQCLHAASFGIYHACAIQLIHQNFTGRNQGRGQALYSSISFGVGGAVGSFYSGYSWVYFSAKTTFLIAAGACLLAIFISIKWVYPLVATQSQVSPEQN